MGIALTNPASTEDRVSASTDWARSLDRYRTPSPIRSVIELAITAVPLALLWMIAWIAVRNHVWWGLLLTIPAAAFLVRLFMVQHDCGHGAFFRQKGLNDWVGRVLGVFTLTPYDDWRQGHAMHHATSGDLDRRGVGDVSTLTVYEYQRLPIWRRVGYRLFRHPVVMFGLGPFFVFILRQRLPGHAGGWRPWLSVMGTNLGIAAFVAVWIWAGGVGPFLMVQLPITLLAGTIGVWLFYVQHQFEGVVWARHTSWNLRDAAMQGSSHYDLPGPLGWFTANIGLHHIHHMSSRIPFYRLRQARREHPELDSRRLSLAQSLRGLSLSLWDEANGKLVSFREARSGKGR